MAWEKYWLLRSKIEILKCKFSLPNILSDIPLVFLFLSFNNNNNSVFKSSARVDDH